MASQPSICNLALAHLGKAEIMSLDDDSPSAALCKQFYEQTRDEVTQSHAWNFAIRRQTLSQLAESPVFGWAYQYQLPADCLRILQLNGYEVYQPDSRYEIEGGKMLTNDETAQVRYIRRVEDATLFPPLFVEALALKIATRLAKPLSGSSSEVERLMAEYERITKPLAVRKDAAEGKSKVKLPWANSRFVRARFGG
ncbi:hypothetical protein TSACC_3688 [Terrimicrobium sacchariphilum]|uniref:Uncharacterized protein n=1 Tax=Terrimicrobium sacchariphilum TaxID=690879 RepID=A0A146GGA8_TERSA|nr:hypothetical protein [Terrimicrobium sacchariphilum]GAT35617.1 hypothetical protein TSACC_3688 [Terrimicrobium sacchariphilum]